MLLVQKKNHLNVTVFLAPNPPPIKYQSKKLIVLIQVMSSSKKAGKNETSYLVEKSFIMKYSG